MKNWKSKFVVAVCGLLTATAMSWAGEDPAKVLSYEIGSEVYYFNYEEKDVMTETGPMYGLTGELKWKFAQNYSLRVQGRGALGQVDYDSTSTGSVDNISDYTFEVRALGGYQMTINNTLNLEPYFGFGCRFLRDQLGGKTSTTGAAGYDRQSQYFYIPTGINIEKSLSSDWDVKLNAEFDVFLKGRQKSELGDALAGLDTLENDQNHGWGARGSVEFVKKMSQYDFVIEPFIRYWDIDQSETENVTFSGTPIGVVGYEPANTTMEVGAKLAIQF